VDAIKTAVDEQNFPAAAIYRDKFAEMIAERSRRTLLPYASRPPPHINRCFFETFGDSSSFFFFPFTPLREGWESVSAAFTFQHTSKGLGLSSNHPFSEGLFAFRKCPFDMSMAVKELCSYTSGKQVNRTETGPKSMRPHIHIHRMSLLPTACKQPGKQKVEFFFFGNATIRFHRLFTGLFSHKKPVHALVACVRAGV
jgi:hypothetical protein